MIQKFKFNPWGYVLGFTLTYGIGTIFLETFVFKEKYKLIDFLYDILISLFAISVLLVICFKLDKKNFNKKINKIIYNDLKMENEELKTEPYKKILEELEKAEEEYKNDKNSNK